jgi:ParB family chromosome partitioning protein
MGRGLAAILSPTIPPEGSESSPELRTLPVELIAPNPRQPREALDEASLLGLADSLRERGVLQPVLVRPRPGGTYELIAGERRWRAAQLAGLDVVPAVVREHADRDSLELALIENMAREDLNPVEEARACALLVEEIGLSREEIGRRVGRSRVAVSNLMRLLDLPDEVLEPHPDQIEAAARLQDAFSAALGADVRVAPRRAGYTVTLSVESLEEAESLAQRLGAIHPA